MHQCIHRFAATPTHFFRCVSLASRLRRRHFSVQQLSALATPKPLSGYWCVNAKRAFESLCLNVTPFFLASRMRAALALARCSFSLGLRNPRKILCRSGRFRPRAVFIHFARAILWGAGRIVLACAVLGFCYQRDAANDSFLTETLPKKTKTFFRIFWRRNLLERPKRDILKFQQIRIKRPCMNIFL